MGSSRLLLIRFCATLFLLGAAVLTSSFSGVAPRANAHNTSTAIPPNFIITTQTNLVSDVPGVAFIQDRLLTNPWGIAAGPNMPFCVVNSGGSSASLYQGDVAGGPLVPNPGLSSIAILPPETVVPIAVQATAVAANTTNSFSVSLTPTSPAAPAQFIFVTRNGAINGWQPAMGAVATVQRFVAGHSYTGVTIATNGSGNFLLAADFTNGKIDVFDNNFNPTSLSGNFSDPTIPLSFHPFNIWIIQ